LRKKILIIGGTGFIGRNLIKKMRLENFEIFSISKKRKLPKNTKNITYKSIDMTNKKKLKKLDKIKFNIVINLGGNIDHQNPKQTLQAHYFGLKNLISILNAKNLELFIQLGSSLEYGFLKSPQKEGQPCEPKSSYGKAKLKATNFLIRKCNSKKIKFVILRPYQIFGPFQKFDRLIPQVIKFCLQNKRFNCTEGNQKRDFLFIDDFVNLILKILNKKKISSGIYNVGFGKALKVKNVIKLIRKIIKTGKPDFGKIKMRKDEMMNLYPKITKVKKYFSWKPKTDFSIGIKKTIKYYKYVH
jgi:nucleoside-diphosphate-sugar epimerase